ncbi:hypothetical protein ACFE04_004139 [Oxalis oulophora]
MGKRNSLRKSAPMLDIDDDDDYNLSITSPSSMARSHHFLNSRYDECEHNKLALLDQTVDALLEKRGSTREKALSAIAGTFSSDMQHDFVEKKFVTLLHPCVNSLKKGSCKEICLASHVIGLLALTVGSGDNAREILDEAVTPISQALISGSDPSKIAALLECLAIITFVGGEDLEQTEKSMQIMWQLAHPKLGSNVIPVKPSAAIITSIVSAWSFLLTTMNVRSLNVKDRLDSIAYLSSLLDKEDRSVRIAAGEALALIFEMGSSEKFSIQSNESSIQSLTHLRGLRAKILDQVRDLSAEASSQGSTKKDLNHQRKLFKDILELLEDGYSPETTMKIGGDSLHVSTWSKLIQLNYMRHFLAGGFVKHMQENRFLHDLFEFTPKKKHLYGTENHMSNREKRLYRSPNSIVNKARTQFMNKQREISKGRHVGHFAITVGGEDYM